MKNNFLKSFVFFCMVVLATLCSRYCASAKIVTGYLYTREEPYLSAAKFYNIELYPCNTLLADPTKPSPSVFVQAKTRPIFRAIDDENNGYYVFRIEYDDELLNPSVCAMDKTGKSFRLAFINYEQEIVIDSLAGTRETFRYPYLVPCSICTEREEPFSDIFKYCDWGYISNKTIPIKDYVLSIIKCGHM